MDENRPVTQEPVPAAPQPLEPIKTTKKGSNITIILLGIIVIVLFLAAGGVGFMYFVFNYNPLAQNTSGQMDDPTPTPTQTMVIETVTPTPTVTTETKLDIMSGLYEKSSSGVLSAIDINTGTKTYTFSNIPAAALRNASGYATDKYIGFHSCNDSTRVCSFYIYDSTTDRVTEKFKAQNGDLVTQSGLYSPTLYAYVVEANNSKVETLYLVNGASTKKVQEFTNPTGRGGRGGFDKDSGKIAFSPDGKHFLKINTAPIHEVYDDTVYVFDTNGTEVAKIETATHPQWMDNNTIVVYKLDDSKDHNTIMTYNITTKATKNLVTGKQTYGGLSYFNNKVLYVTGVDPKDYTINEYNITTAKNTVLMKGVAPVWVSSTKFIYNTIKEAEVMDGFENTATILYDVNARTTKTLSTGNLLPQYYTEIGW
jgi:hypothetical protein